ncbi:MAG: TetR/AcrR family transcriptional regulator [Oscillospiraceae bacterium]|nr:TetR/AcrR family transcriptional regulator [Oscillospiraceae bacterium]
MEKSEDRRVIKTKKAIRNAFARLLSEKELGDITVSDIAEYADINRKTFYNYYAGVHEVVYEIEDEIARSFGGALGTLELSSVDNAAYFVFERLTSVINTDIDFYGQMFSMRGNVSMLTKIVDIMKDKARPLITELFDLTGDRLEVIMEFTFSGLISVYQRWFNSDRSIPVEEISSAITKLVISGMGGFAERN